MNPAYPPQAVLVPLRTPAHEFVAFHLAQSWRPCLEPLFRPGHVQLAWTPSQLIVEADLADEHVFTTATGDNQRMWELGDVFEMFLQVAGRKEYAELHVTPNGKRLHLQFPGGQPVHPAAFRASAVLTSGGWRVEAGIPPEVVGLERFGPGLELRVSFCRYDATPGEQPVLSSTAHHPIASFHRPAEWPCVVLTQSNPA